LTHPFPIVNALFAPGTDGKLKIVNAVVTLTTETHFCFRAQGRDWLCDETARKSATPQQYDQAVAALKSALGGK
jgi:hypothetical protein